MNVPRPGFAAEHLDPAMPGADRRIWISARPWSIYYGQPQSAACHSPLIESTCHDKSDYSRPHDTQILKRCDEFIFREYHAMPSPIASQCSKMAGPLDVEIGEWRPPYHRLPAGVAGVPDRSRRGSARRINQRFCLQVGDRSIFRAPRRCRTPRNSFAGRIQSTSFLWESACES